MRRFLKAARMFVVRIVSTDKSVRMSFVARFYNALKARLVSGNVFYDDRNVYILLPDDVVSMVFAYAAYLKAKKMNADAEILYATKVDPVIFPEDIRIAGRAWINRRLKIEDLEALRKKYSVNENVL